MIIANITTSGYMPKLAIRKQNNIRRESMREVGTYWHGHFREKHFTREGASEYGYAQRSRGYMIAKARVKHHQDPLVWSGESREQSRALHVVPTATQAEAKVKVILHTPKLNYIPKGGTINLRDEMTRVSQREVTVLAGVAGDSLDRQFNALSDRSTTRIEG
jgi:hypothetical protein